ncbi:MAG TPA: hypothetical protein VFE14_02100 [Micromonosporaceae bacterium]|nr:hypothetical protein [Micromonosporaceae bacterium]
MTDFDAALERLLNDPSFAVSLAADPSAALAGYQLGPDEIALLSAQVSADAGGQSAVEERTSKASMFGLLAPLAGAAGLGEALPGTHAGFGAAQAAAQSGFGGAGGPAAEGFGGPDGDLIGQGVGAAPDGVPGMGESLWTDPGGGALHGGPLGGALDDRLSGLIGERISNVGFGAADSGGGTSGIGDAMGAGADPASSAMPPLAGPPPEHYHTRVDVNGDGQWDKHWYVQRDDGGVDILADMNHDGRADFVGHDYDRDGLVDAADYDKNRDGRFETHMFDDNGDGWLDRKIVSPEPPLPPDAPTS